MFKCNGRIKANCKCSQGKESSKETQCSTRNKIVICNICGNEQIVSDIEFGEVTLCNHCQQPLKEADI